MATMTNQQHADLSADFHREISEAREVVPGCIRSDIRAAIDAVDQWIDSNAVSYNNALPTAAKNNLTASQKARLLAAVLTRRFKLGT